MSHYRATISDFYVGRIYEQQAGDMNKWSTTMFSDEYLDTRLGHSYFMEILANLARFKDRPPYYRIKHLDDKDIESFGFTHVKEDLKITNESNYTAFKNDNIILLFNKESLLVSIYEEIKERNEIVLQRLFHGQLLDFNELKFILISTGLLFDGLRAIKFKERV